MICKKDVRGDIMLLYSLVTKYWHLPKDYEQFKSELKKIVQKALELNPHVQVEKVLIEVELSDYTEYIYINIKTTDEKCYGKHVFVYDIKTDQMTYIPNLNERDLKAFYKTQVNKW